MGKKNQAEIKSPRSFYVSFPDVKGLAINLTTEGFMNLPIPPPIQVSRLPSPGSWGPWAWACLTWTASTPLPGPHSEPSLSRDLPRPLRR